MAATPISRLARQQVYNRLADDTLGWNTLIASANSTYDLDPPIETIDFNSPDNFLFASTSPLVLEQTATFAYPLICLYTHGIVNENLEKFHKFAGKLVVGLDVWLSWEKQNGFRDFETYGDAVEETIVEIVNGFGPDGFGQVTQDWGNKVVYNGGLSCSRTELSLAADNWLQGFQFRLTFIMTT